MQQKGRGTSKERERVPRVGKDTEATWVSKKMNNQSGLKGMLEQIQIAIATKLFASRVHDVVYPRCVRFG